MLVEQEGHHLQQLVVLAGQALLMLHILPPEVVAILVLLVVLVVLAAAAAVLTVVAMVVAMVVMVDQVLQVQEVLAEEQPITPPQTLIITRSMAVAVVVVAPPLAVRVEMEVAAKAVVLYQEALREQQTQAAVAVVEVVPLAQVTTALLAALVSA